MKRLSPPRARRVVAPAVLALTAALALPACSHDAKDAAVVNGEAITMDQVQTVTHEYNQINPSNQVTPDKTLPVFIEGHFALQQQSKAGQGVSTDDARNLMKDQLHIKDPSPTLVQFFRRVIAVQAARQDPATIKQIQSQLDKADITINPRYGSKFDTKQRTVVASAPSWIKPAQGTTQAGDSSSTSGNN